MNSCKLFGSGLPCMPMNPVCPWCGLLSTKRIGSIFSALVLLSAAPVFGNNCKQRAVWFWSDSESLYGAVSVVGSAERENETVEFFRSHGISAVYGSYRSRPVSEPGVIAAWNTKLDAEGIESQFLLSENTWIFPEHRDGLIDRITARVILFNAGQGDSGRFDGLHLDIEPQGLPEWSTATDSEKRDLLFLLADTYAAVRTHFVTNGLPDFPVYADLPVWFDNLSSIGWVDAAERDAWFASVSSSLTGVSLMPFRRNSFGGIDSGVEWERSNIDAAVRVALEAHISAEKTWATSFDFNAMMEAVETAYGTAGATDVQSYSSWREVLDAESFSGVDLTILTQPLSLQAELQFETDAGWTYAILHSDALCNWQETARFSATFGASTHVPVAATNRIGYWKVQRLIPLSAE